MASEEYITREFSDIKGIDASCPPSEAELDRAVAADNLIPKNGELVTRPSLVHAGVFRRSTDKTKGAFGVYSAADRVYLRFGSYMLEWLSFPKVFELKYTDGELSASPDYRIAASTLSSRVEKDSPLSADATAVFGDELFVYDKNGVFRFAKSGLKLYSPTAALARMKAIATAAAFSKIDDRDAPFIFRSGKYVGRKNMLSPCFRIGVTADGESRVFALGLSGAKAISCVYTVGGTAVFRKLSEVDAASVTLSSAPDKGSEIVVLCYKSISSDDACEPLTKAFGTVFDGRVFLCAAAESGSNGRVIFSAEGDPFFFPENGVCFGSEGTEALTEVGKYLVAVEKAGAASPRIRFHYPRSVSSDTIGKDYPAEYGIYDCGVLGVGNAKRHLGSPLFVSEDGIKRITPSAANGTASLEDASVGIDGLLKSNGGTPRLAQANGAAYLSLGTELFVSVSREKNGRTGKTENGWFRWTRISSPSGDAPFLISKVGTEKSGRLTVFSETEDGGISVEYLDGDADSDFEETKEERTIEPFFATAATAFSSKTRLKRLSKRGCSFSGSGDGELYIVPDSEPLNSVSVPERFKVGLYGHGAYFAFRPTSDAAKEFGAVVKGRGRIRIGRIVLSARKTKKVGGLR